MKKLIAKSALLFAALIFLPAFGSGERLFAPGVDLWPRWQAHDPGSTTTVDHSAWDRFLKAHVRDRPGANLVDYQAAARDRAALDGYLAKLSATPVSTLNRAEQMAFWINLYNALTVRVILDHMPVDSIRDIDISPGILSSGPWDAKLIQIEVTDLTLNDIEHRILRPIWNDPRVHYAVNCASIGCPDLAPSAYTGTDLNAALDRAAKAYVNDPRGVSVVGDDVVVSRIYDWFIEDFGDSEAGVIAHLRKHGAPDLAHTLKGGLDDTHYDWSLNSVR